MEISKELANLKKEIISFQNSFKRLKEIKELINDDEYISLALEELEEVRKDILLLEEESLFKGEYDHLNCYLEIHPGAGGTEACDWAQMLLNMYQRFCEKNNYTYEEVDVQKAEEAGVKSVTLKIKGDKAYGLLKNESGVHRLVRISPFDAGRRRHTSFAAVSITPLFSNNINIEIKEEDLKIDVYHSSGAGGQSVNTSNSAVRITHLPTKTVVSSQIERSQLLNKEQALAMLKNKLYLKALEENEKKINGLKNTDIAINFGSQIRSYILEPYKLVKDHRSNYENNEPEKVLDGDIKEMLLYNLQNIKGEQNG